MNPSRSHAFIDLHRPVATTLLTVAVAIAGAIAFTESAGFTAATGGFPDHQRGRVAAGREPRHHGVVDRHPP
jgi:hypothetical protein